MRILVTTLIGSLCTAALAQEPPLVAPDRGPLQAVGGFGFAKKPNKTRRSLSGIACPTGAATCLVVFDEGVEARHVTFPSDGYRAEPEPLVLRPGGDELDAEGAATDGRVYYVTGSHSAKRSDCETNPDSRYVLRFELDPKTGRAARDASGKLAGLKETGGLWGIMAAQPDLAAHVGDGMCLGSKGDGKRGINIEGLAVRDGQLFFGLRGPSRGKEAGILAVDAAALFEGGDAKPSLKWIEVGEGRAVRDLQAVRDGILVLAGPDDDNGETGWSVLRWTPETSDARLLARLDLGKVAQGACDEDLKPEALAVREDEPGRPYRITVLSDGMCDGGPLDFTVSR